MNLLYLLFLAVFLRRLPTLLILDLSANALGDCAALRSRGSAHFTRLQVTLLVAHQLAHPVRHLVTLLVVLGGALLVILALVAVGHLALCLRLVGTLIVVHCSALRYVLLLKIYHKVFN
jgi:hypothetical protein